jgi:hypothetical protein
MSGIVQNSELLVNDSGGGGGGGTVDQGVGGVSAWLVTGTVSVNEPVIVDAVNLDIRDLVFATDKVDASGSTGVGVTGPLTDTQLRATAVPISATTLPLPTGASTLAAQTQPGVDIGDVTINNASGASAVNIQDGGNIITVDGTITANAGTNLNTSLLNLETTQTSVKTAVEIIDNFISGSRGLVTEDNSAAIAASLSVIDDWDETDRAKVNTIAGQVGVQGASGISTALTQRVVLATDIALPAGTNAIGKLAANSGVDIGDIDITSIIPLTGATNLGKAEDAVHASGDVGIEALAVANEANTVFAADGDYVPFGTDREGSTRNIGNRAHDAADSGSPIKLGGRADTTFQTAVADGDRVDALFDVYGHLFVRKDHANLWSYHENSSSALTDTSVKAAPASGFSIYVTDIIISLGAATALNVFFEEGSTTILGPYYLEAVNGRSIHIGFQTPKKLTSATALTITTSAAVAHSIDVTGFIAP